jgi:predicted NAD/FAD-dependent oxidoreductase
LTAATVLQEQGIQATVLDKGRGIGGRLATRRFSVENNGEGVFDYGAQYFTVRDERFRRQVQKWVEAGIVREWFPNSRFSNEQDNPTEPRYIANGGIRSIAKQLAGKFKVHTSTRVVKMALQGNAWQITTANGESFHGDSVILTPPVPQSLELLNASAISLPGELAAKLKTVSYFPCIAVLALLKSASRMPAPGALRLAGEPVRWIADNQQKGISPHAAAVTIHAGPEFSRENWNTDPAEIARQLFEAVRDQIGSKMAEYQVHRWRYSQPYKFFGEAFASVNLPAPLFLAGDAFIGDRVESAFLSGLAVAEHILSFLDRD